MADPAVPTIPENAILLHVGLPKTGTTALQHSAAQQREALLEHGVLYPGTRHNHGNASYSVAGKRRGWSQGPGAAKTPTLKHWDALVEEVHAERDRRVFVSHEFFAEYPRTVCEKVAEDLGGEIRVVFTLRNQPAVLASSWQEYVKSGYRLSFEAWLEAVLAEEPDRSVTPTFQRRRAQAATIEKWQSVVGRDNVTAIVLDPDHRELLTDTFEQMLGLPRTFLRTVTLNGGQANRSFSLPEAETVRAINEVLLTTDGMTWKDYRNIFKYGGVERMLENRRPGPDEPRLLPPTWAVERMSEQTKVRAEQIAATGVRVVGDLENLWKPVPSVAELPPVPSTVPLEIARELVLGTFSGGKGRGPSFGPAPAPRAPRPAPAPPPAPAIPPASEGPVVQARAVASVTRSVPVTRVLLAAALRTGRRVVRAVTSLLPGRR